MGNRKLIYFFALILTIVFTSFYYFVFAAFCQQTKGGSQQHLYMNQVGLYRKEESVVNIMERLEGAGCKAYRMKNGELTGVVSGVSTLKKETIAQQEKLNQLKMNFLLKKITTKDSMISNAIKSKDYANALELINDESKRNE
ncbi:MAG: SPOR domain-containing protein [Erysipelotrichaceae bacterium]